MARPDLDLCLFVEYFGQCNFPHMMFLADLIDEGSIPFAPRVKEPDQQRPSPADPSLPNQAIMRRPPTRCGL